MATKKRSLNALGGGNGSGLGIAAAADTTHPELLTEEAIKGFIARSIATVLVTTDRAGISDADLESLVEETMRLMAREFADSGGFAVTDPASSAVGRVARSYTEVGMLTFRKVLDHEIINCFFY